MGCMERPLGVLFTGLKSRGVAENEHQALIINTLIDYYRTGDLSLFDKYSILWLQIRCHQVDFVNGFIEDYGDPMGIRLHGNRWSTLRFGIDQAYYAVE